jgi:uncharacterized protein with PQ loop repeat
VSWHAFSTIAGVLGVLGGYWTTWIQLQRVKTVGVEGVSLATWLLFLWMGFFWAGYGLAISNHLMWLGSLPLLPVQAALVWKLRPLQQPQTIVATFFAITLLSFTTSAIWGWNAGVAGTTVAMFWNRLPQIVELIRDPDVRGVSVSSWMIGSVCSALWVIYYFGSSMWFPLVATAVATVSNLVIALLALWRQRQQARVAIAV